VSRRGWTSNSRSSTLSRKDWMVYEELDNKQERLEIDKERRDIEQE
jgi:hypothetical protein